MDFYDLKILNILQHDARLTAEKIAERVGLSPSAIHRRVKRLREEGVIEAEVAVISPEAAGLKLTAIVEVTMQRERPLSRPQEEFRRLVLDTPEVMQCYHVTGNADFVLLVVTKDIQEYEALTRRLFVDNPNVRGYSTSIVMRRVKSGLTIPLADK
ncbi:MAG: Lrp/AsnC family transcriptional regulator [Acidobacteriota bacterium]|nr:Lrp/AsnC family transcriptional regulator [Acidobacteriota bacterium]